MNLFNIGAITTYPLTTGHESCVSTVVVQVSGITGASGSMVPQLRISMEGQNLTPPSWVNCTYLNQATGATVAAGTAIAADGIYEFSTNGCFLRMNVTAVTGSFQCYVTPLEGPSGINGGGGSGSGGAVTIANGADVALGTTTDAPATAPTTTTAATVISLLKEEVNLLATTPTTPLQVVPSDATGANNANALIINSGPLVASTYGLPVMAYLTARNGTVANPVWTLSNIGADATNGQNAIGVGNFRYNGSGGTTGYDREWNNINVTILTSASRTTTQTSADQVNYNGRGIHVVVDTTVIGTGSITLTINGKDNISGKYYTLLSGAAIVTNTTNVYKVFPGAPATSNVSVNDMIPRLFQIVVTANNANAATYTVGYSLVV